jgi:glucose-1-phosphate thymidylyltransferase
MLETNEAMLARGRARRPKSVGDSRIIDPVYIEDNVTLKKSKIGPNVSIGNGSVIEGAEVSHSIIGSRATIRKSVLKNSLVGDDAIVEGVKGEVTVGDHSEVHAS